MMKNIQYVNAGNTTVHVAVVTRARVISVRAPALLITDVARGEHADIRGRCVSNIAGNGEQT